MRLAKMPTKNINDVTWRKIEIETVRAVIATKAALKDTEVMTCLIEKGLKTISDQDYEEFIKSKRKKKA